MKDLDWKQKPKKLPILKKELDKKNYKEEKKLKLLKDRDKLNWLPLKLQKKPKLLELLPKKKLLLKQ